MPHFDGQTIIAFAIVAVAFSAIGRRLWGQIRAFGSRPVRRRPSRSAQRPTPPPTAAPLIQLQLKPPAHLKRPPSED